MQKVLHNEKHQGPIVNHTTFRFSCNIGDGERNMLEYEKYLSQIENSFDTSKEMQVKKKIAGRFSTKLAYDILKQVEFKTNYDNSAVTALIPNNLNLSKRQTEILSEQLEAVYGMNRYYVGVLEEEDIIEVLNEQGGYNGGQKEVTEGFNKLEDTGLDINKNLVKRKHKNTKEQAVITPFTKKLEGVPLSMIPTNTVWHHIRKGLIKELGENIDKAWFSKVKAEWHRDMETLKLTMPTRFMADWVRNNYSHVIQRLSKNCGIKLVEYGCG